MEILTRNKETNTSFHIRQGKCAGRKEKQDPFLESGKGGQGRLLGGIHAQGAKGTRAIRRDGTSTRTASAKALGPAP